MRYYGDIQKLAMEISPPKAKVQQDTGKRNKDYNVHLKPISRC